MLNFGIGQLSRSIVIYLICLFLRVRVSVCLVSCLWVREHRACNEVVGVSMGMVGGMVEAGRLVGLFSLRAGKFSLTLLVPPSKRFFSLTRWFVLRESVSKPGTLRLLVRLPCLALPVSLSPYMSLLMTEHRELPPRAKTHMAAGGALNQQSI